MKARNLLITLLVIVLTAGIVRAEDNPTGQLSNTRQASVTFKIASEPKVFPMGVGANEVERLNRLIRKPELAISAYQQILGASDGWQDFKISIEDKPINIGDFQVARVQLNVRLKDKQKPAAKELLEAYIEMLKSALHKEYDLARKLHMKKLDVYMQRRDQAEMNLHNLLNAQSQLVGGHGKLDKESVRERILEHERAMIENNMQQTILRKRAEEISFQIQTIKAKTEALSRDDEIVQISKDVVMNLEEQLDKQQQSYKSGLISSEEVSSLKDRLLRSKLELSKRLQQLQSQSAEDAHELNRQLRETTMQLEELEIKETVLAGYSPGDISSSIEYEMLEVKIEAAKEKLRRAIIARDQAALEVDLLQSPAVSYGEIICSETAAQEDD